MPNDRSRHVVVETDDLANAIDTVAPSYPGESRAEVLRHLVHFGAETISEVRSQHHRIVRERAGRHPRVYPSGYLDEAREDWPA